MKMKANTCATCATRSFPWSHSADTGLRVHEACGLRRGDLDWNEGRAVIIGKGNKQAVVRFSRRSITALRDYLAARASLDGASGRQVSALPLFART